MVSNYRHFVDLKLCFIDLLIGLPEVGLVLLGNFKKYFVQFLVVLVYWVVHNVIAFNLALQSTPHVFWQILNSVLVL